MGNDNEPDEGVFMVVVNHEHQHTLWPAHREPPPGWTWTGVSGVKADCLAYIESAWTDVRPLSIQRDKQHGQFESTPAPAGERSAEPEGAPALPGASVVERLLEGRHAVEVALCPGAAPGEAREALSRGRVRIRFPATRGDTELRIRLTPRPGRRHPSDSAPEPRTLELEGELTLDGRRLRCVVDLDPATLRGEGHLVPLMIP